MSVLLPATADPCADISPGRKGPGEEEVLGNTPALD